jgi:hypothetical protein
MTKLIGCLGWGSLVWDPRGLPIRGTWFTDGPFLPIEFAHQSEDDRITLVIVRNEDKPLVRSLWTVMSVPDVDQAKERLAEREGIKNNIAKYIGVWSSSQSQSDDPNDSNDPIKRIGAWAKRIGLDAVVWTDLHPYFKYRDGRTHTETPTKEDVVSHLSDLRGQKRDNAERYIRMTPRQIDTDYRQYIEAKLYWLPYQAAR